MYLYTDWKEKNTRSWNKQPEIIENYFSSQSECFQKGFYENKSVAELH